jgi:hypothetical protein
MDGPNVCKRQNRATGAAAMIAQSVTHRSRDALGRADRPDLAQRLRASIRARGGSSAFAGERFAVSALMCPMSRHFVASLDGSSRGTRCRSSSPARDNAGTVTLDTPLRRAVDTLDARLCDMAAWTLTLLRELSFSSWASAPEQSRGMFRLLSIRDQRRAPDAS